MIAIRCWAFLHWLVPLAGALGEINDQWFEVNKDWRKLCCVIYRHLDSRQHRSWTGLLATLSYSSIRSISHPLFCLRRNLLDDGNAAFLGNHIRDYVEGMATRTTKAKLGQKASLLPSSGRFCISLALGFILLFQWQNLGWWWWWDPSVRCYPSFPIHTVVERAKDVDEWYMAICTASWMVWNVETNCRFDGYRWWTKFI